MAREFFRFFLILITLIGNILFAQTQGEIHWPTLAKSDWPMGHKDPQSTGRSPFKGPQEANYIKKYDFYSGIFSGPIIGLDDRLYFGGYGLNQDTKFYCTNLDAKIIWQYNEPFTLYMGTPALQTSDSVIYIGSGNGYLYAFNPNGTVRWTYNAGSIISAPSNFITVNLDSTIYFGTTNKYLHAVRPDGTLKWKIKYESGFFDLAPAISPDGNTLYTCGTDSNLYALNLDGTIKWKYSAPGNSVNPPTVDSEGNIYYYYVDAYKLHLLSLYPDMSLRWMYSSIDTCYVTFPGSAMTIDKNGNLYLVASFSKGVEMYSLDYSGNLRWSLGFPDERMGITQPLICDSLGTVFCGSTQGFFYYAVSSAGKLLWKIPLYDYQVDNTGLSVKTGYYIKGFILFQQFFRSLELLLQ